MKHGMMPGEEEELPPEEPQMEEPVEAPVEEQDSSVVGDDEGMEEATPEEQERYEEFVKTGFGEMYKGGRVRPEILKMLDEDPSDLMSVLENVEEMQQFSPIIALAATTAIICVGIVEETGETDGTIILHGGKAILEDLVEIAEKAGIREYSEEEMMQAARMAADLFREAAVDKGLIDLDEAKAEWDEITAADKEGRLGEVLPQLAAAAPPEEESPYGAG